MRQQMRTGIGFYLLILVIIAAAVYVSGTLDQGGQKTYNIVNFTQDLEQSIQGVDCLLIEDIIDTGYTLSMLKPMLLERKPESFKICTLLNKPDRREVEMEADYTGFSIPDEFVVGYGLDYAQKYRNLPFVGTLEFVEE